MTQTYSIESILGMKDKFKEPPYPGFNLMDVCRKRSAQGPQKLARTSNAYHVTNATTQEAAIKKTMQGVLNKLTPEKYDEILEGLSLDQLIEEDAMPITIDMIFAKALLEPGYSKMYAKFCHDIAIHEVNSQVSSPSAAEVAAGAEKKGPRSMFRNLIVTRAQKEFQSVEVIDDSLTPEKKEERIAAQAKRKRANIKFVGQLYMQKVLSSTVMHRIITSLVSFDVQAKQFPKEIDVEVLCELLETVGKSIDQTTDGREQMNSHFDTLGKLLKAAENKKVNYGAKVRFKIMDTLELRENDWVPRVERTGGMTPATLKELQEMQTRANSETILSKPLSSTVKSPTTKTPNRRQAPMFPSVPPVSSSSDMASPASTGSQAGPSWRNVSSSGPPTPARAPNETPKPPQPKVSFDDRVQMLLGEWTEGSGEPLVDWDKAFADYPDVSEDNISDLIAASCIKAACMTSKGEAQKNACGFLANGLGIGKVPLLTGVGKVIERAVLEDLPSDAPLFYPRLVTVIRSCCGGDSCLDIYRDAIVSTFFAYDQLRRSCEAEGDASEVESMIPQILDLWAHLPKENVDGPGVVSAIIASRGGESPANDLVLGLLKYLVESEVITKEHVQRWMATPQAAAASDLVPLLQKQVLGE